MALVQVYNYMLQHGVGYGFVAAGEAVVFLYVCGDDLRILRYSLCMPRNDGGVVNSLDIIVAQMAAFCALACRADPLYGSDFIAMFNRMEKKVKEWPEQYLEDCSEGLSGDAYTPSKDGKKRDGPGGPGSPDGGGNVSQGPTRQLRNATKQNKISAGGRGNGAQGPAVSPLTRQYCTQACLLGLKNGQRLDERCPNVSSHRRAKGDRQHTVTATKLVSLVRG